MELTSPAYADGATMPARYATRDVAGGLNVSIPLRWAGEPADTRSFVLTLIDHHPVAHEWVHWLVIDLPATAHELSEGASHGAGMPFRSLELVNTRGTTGYSGPRPPHGTGPHDYEATVYALDIEELGLGSAASLEDVVGAMRGHVLTSASTTGFFQQ